MKKRFIILTVLFIAFTTWSCSDDENEAVDNYKTYNEESKDIYISRNAGNKIFKYTNIILADTGAIISDGSLTVDLSDLGSISTKSTNFDIMFFNESAYASETATTGTGTPGIAFGGNVEVYDIGKYSILSSIEEYASTITYDIAKSLPYSSEKEFTFPLPSELRNDNGFLCPRSKVIEFYNSNLIIGTSFQNTSSDVSPEDQTVYFLKINNNNKIRYFIFMVYSFQNGDSNTNIPATDKRYITLKYKLLFEKN